MSVFREEQVGVGDDFFLQRLGAHVALWQWQPLGTDILDTQTDADVAFTDQSMAMQAVLVEQCGADNAVGNVRLTAMTAELRLVGVDYAEIVQPGCLLDESPVNLGLPTQPRCNCDGQPCDLAAVAEQDRSGQPMLRVICIDEFKGLHGVLGKC